MRHRAFHPDRFCTSVEPEQLQRLLEAFDVPPATATRLVLDQEQFRALCDAPEARPATAELVETLQRINDLAEGALRFVLDEYRRARIRSDGDQAPERLTIRLYLDHRAAFEAAWSNYVLFGTTANLASYRLAGELAVAQERLPVFAEAVRAHFARRAKGDHCTLVRSDSESGVVLRVDHGLHLQTLRYLEEGRPRHRTIRPAREDILFYERRTGLLHIRAAQEADRDAYLRLFAAELVGDERLATSAGGQPLYTLAPLGFGRFSFDGDGAEVRAVQLRQVRMRLYGRPSTVLTLRSDDVRSSFAEELVPLTLASGELLEARFRLLLWPTGGKPAWVSLTIRPPARTDLTQAKYAEIVEHYLETQGVRIP